jgi:peptide/nickel transport system ATP-binding protein
MTLLAVEDLAIEVPGGRAVDGLSFTLEPGEVLGLVGEGGAGKSLAGAAIIGMLPAAARVAAGRVLLDGERIDDLDETDWEDLRGTRIAAVFADACAALDPLQTVGSLLSEALHARYPLTNKVADERIGDWLRAVGLPLECIGARPHDLSRAMCQAVALALALCIAPELLVADEPAQALDAAQRAQLAALLRRTARRQRTAVLLISRDLRGVAAAADRIGVMYAGQLVELAATTDLLRAPAHPYTAALLASLPGPVRRRQRLPVIDGAMPPPDEMPRGCAFHPRCGRVVARCRVERPALWPAGTACWQPLPASAAAAGGGARG